MLVYQRVMRWCERLGDEILGRKSLSSRRQLRLRLCLELENDADGDIHVVLTFVEKWSGKFRFTGNEVPDFSANSEVIDDVQIHASAIAECPGCVGRIALYSLACRSLRVSGISSHSQSCGDKWREASAGKEFQFQSRSEK